MPITVQVAQHPAEVIDGSVLLKSLDNDQHNFGKESRLITRFLQKAAPDSARHVQQVLQSTLSCEEVLTKVVPRQNGLVHTCLEAYNRHRHLVLRPDDIWIAIVTQFSFFVNKNAEELRSYFVAHKGKKELVVKLRGPEHFAEKTTRMADLVHENVLDKDLQTWIIPDFSTTTPIDKVVCSAVMMATVKEYFSYKGQILCGIPSVTLLGDVSDWESILQRLDKLPAFDAKNKQLTTWKGFLTPVIQNMIQCFHEPEKQVDFWSKIAHFRGGGSGPTYISGWITAFCVFSEKGKWQACSEEIYDNYFEDGAVKSRQRPRLSLQDIHSHKIVSYPSIDSQDVPPGCCEVDVKIEYLGMPPLMSVMVAGLAGMTLSSKTPGSKDVPQVLDTVQPFAGWWIFLIDEKAKKKEEEEEKKWRMGVLH